MMTWNGTSNAIIGTLRGNKGLPVVLDESSVSNMKDFSSMVYTLAIGREKGRMDKEANLIDPATWFTTILSNGEHSLSIKSNRNVGVQVRMSEFGNVTWTKDARNAEAIEEGVLKNYGHAAPMIAERLMEIGKDSLITRWKECKEECTSMMKADDQFAPRIASKIAILIITAGIAEEVLNIGLNVEAIRDLIFGGYNQDQKTITTENYKVECTEQW